MYFGDWDNLRLYPTGGAYHGSDVEMVFGASQDVSGLLESTPETTVKKMVQKAWAAYASDPANGMTNVIGWPQYNPNCEFSCALSLGSISN
jgi:cholinesterase